MIWLCGYGDLRGGNRVCTGFPLKFNITRVVLIYTPGFVKS